MCAQLDRRPFSTRLIFFIAGQPERCFADPPTRFRLMVSADITASSEEAKRDQQLLDVSTVRFIFLRLTVGNFLLSRRVLRHFGAWAVLTPLCKVIQGRRIAL